MPAPTADTLAAPLVLGGVDLANPVDNGHILGDVEHLVLPLPEMVGGTSVYPLVGTRKGDFQNDLDGDNWIYGSNRIGVDVLQDVANSIVFAASEDNDSFSFSSTLSAFSVFIIARWDGVNDDFNAAFDTFEPNSAHLATVEGNDSSSGSIVVKTDDGSNVHSLSIVDVSLSSNQGEIFFITYSYDANDDSAVVYRDGVQQDSTTGIGTVDASSLDISWGGRDNRDFNTHLNGAVYGSALSIGTAWTDAQHKRLYREYQRGFPNLLNRRVEQQLYVSSSGTTVTESAQLNATASLSAAETGTATESASVDSTGSLRAAETGIATESASVAGAASLAAADTAVATESAAITAAAALSAQETAKALETATITPTASLSATETATAKETATILANASLSAAETGIATETAQVNVTASLTANEKRGDVPQGRVSTVGENKASLLSGGANTTEQIGRQGNQVERL